MGSRDASQSVFFCSLSEVFSEQEDSGCEEGPGGVGFLRVFPKSCHFFFKEMNFCLQIIL